MNKSLNRNYKSPNDNVDPRGIEFIKDLEEIWDIKIKFSVNGDSNLDIKSSMKKIYAN